MPASVSILSSVTSRAVVEPNPGVSGGRDCPMGRRARGTRIEVVYCLRKTSPHLGAQPRGSIKPLAELAPEQCER